MMVAPITPIQLIVGLGNPGQEYENTRHNAGFWAVDVLAQKLGALWKYESRFHGACAMSTGEAGKLYFLKPATFMNRSGQSVIALAHFYKIPAEAILVVHDELDLLPGTSRLKWAGGHAGHNGLKDIIRLLGHANFWRFRVGIGHPGDRSRVADYVLSLPKLDDRIAIDQSLDHFIAGWSSIQKGQFEKAMHELHSKS